MIRYRNMIMTYGWIMLDTDNAGRNIIETSLDHPLQIQQSYGLFLFFLRGIHWTQWTVYTYL